MTEHRWTLFFRQGTDEASRYGGTDHSHRHGYAERNPSTGEWSVSSDVRHATIFASEAIARSALTRARPRLACDPWLIPARAWILRRVGDVGEPLTRYHEDVDPLADTAPVSGAA